MRRVWLQVAELTKKLQLTTHDANLTQMNVLQLQERQGATGREVEAKAEDVSMVRTQVEAARTGIASQTQVERVQAHQLDAQARLARRLVAAAEGTYMPSATEEELREHIAQGDDTSVRLRGVIDALAAEMPAYAPMLTSMVQAIAAT